MDRDRNKTARRMGDVFRGTFRSVHKNNSAVEMPDRSGPARLERYNQSVTMLQLHENIWVVLELQQRKELVSMNSCCSIRL